MDYQREISSGSKGSLAITTFIRNQEKMVNKVAFKFGRGCDILLLVYTDAVHFIISILKFLLKICILVPQVCAKGKCVCPIRSKGCSSDIKLPNWCVALMPSQIIEGSIRYER